MQLCAGMPQTVTLSAGGVGKRRRRMQHRYRHAAQVADTLKLYTQT